MRCVKSRNALTPQMIEIFQKRFPGQTAVLHSRLTPAEKKIQWELIRTGAARVVLGARSAVFAPLAKPGLIVLDEEHETTYKQEEAPRYHARDVAWWRVRYHRAVLILGSATPSLESYYETTRKGAALLTMSTRATQSQLPPVRVVDMRRELKEGHRHIFSRPHSCRLAAGPRQERAGSPFPQPPRFASFVLCRSAALCSAVLRAPFP